jgi:predicted nucleic acid-binding protein
MKLDEKNVQDIEKIKRLTWFERHAVKKMITKAKKAVLIFQEKVELEVKDRLLLEKEVLSMLDILEIETDDGVLLDKITIKTQTNQNLENALVECLREMEKLI